MSQTFEVIKLIGLNRKKIYCCAENIPKIGMWQRARIIYCQNNWSITKILSCYSNYNNINLQEKPQQMFEKHWSS